MCLFNPQGLQCKTLPTNSAAPELHLTCKILWKTKHIPQGPNKPISPPFTCRVFPGWTAVALGTNNPFLWSPALDVGCLWAGEGECSCAASSSNPSGTCGTILSDPCGWDSTEISLAGCKDNQHCSLPLQPNCVFPRKKTLHLCRMEEAEDSGCRHEPNEGKEQSVEDSRLRTVQV